MSDYGKTSCPSLFKNTGITVQFKMSLLNSDKVSQQVLYRDFYHTSFKLYLYIYNVKSLCKSTFWYYLQQGINFLTRVSADGNCLYNSASVVVNGSENLSLTLRALTSIELFLYAEYYASHSQSPSSS